MFTFAAGRLDEETGECGRLEVAEEGGISAGGAGRGVMEGSTFGSEPSFDDTCEFNVDCLEVVVDVVVGVGDLATLP